MLIEQKLEQIKLSSSQNAAMNFILEKRQFIESMTIKELADASYTSTGTIIRLAKKLGYQGYEDFKQDYLKEIYYLDTHFINIDPNYPFHKDDNIQKIASKITTLACETSQDTFALLEHDQLQKAVWSLKNSNQIHLIAISYCLLLGEIFKLDMARIGRTVNVCHINGEELFIPATVQKGDCVIMISYSGQIEKLCILAKLLKEKEITLIVISSIGDNQLKSYADIQLFISTREKLHSKIKGYANENSIKQILDILYSCYFALDYDKNLEYRLEISKFGEQGRNSTIEIMKEDEYKSSRR